MVKALKDNTTMYINELDRTTYKEIFLTLQDRLLNEEGEIDSYDISDMMNYRLCDIYDNEHILYSEVLKWSNNMSIK